MADSCVIKKVNAACTLGQANLKSIRRIRTDVSSNNSSSQTNQSAITENQNDITQINNQLALFQSGTWTPTFTAISGPPGFSSANFAGVASDENRFIRINNIVQISGSFGLNAVPVAATMTNIWRWAMSLPIATNMGGAAARSRLSGSFNIESSFPPGDPEISDGNAAAMGIFGKDVATVPVGQSTAEFFFEIIGGTDHTEGFRVNYSGNYLIVP